MSAEPLVVGVDVGSQGTCAQAIGADGELAHSSYVPHELSYPRPGWAEQDPASWLGAVGQALAEVRRATAGRPLLAVSFGSQLDGLVAARGDGEPCGPALIWMDRRAGAQADAAAERIDAARLRELTGCNLDPGHVAAKIAWLAEHRPDEHEAARWFLLPGSFVAWRASGEPAVDPSNASSTMLLDVATRDWSQEACAAFDVDPARLPPVLPPHRVLGPVAPWLRDAAGLDPSTQVVLGCGDEMAATLGAGVVDPGSVCDVMGTAEPVCAVTTAPALDPDGVTELHPHADPDGWLLENPGWLSGGAYRWFRDELGSAEAARAAATGSDVYELLNDLAAGAPAGADGVLWVPALAGATAPEWNADARAGWFGLTAAHGRAHLARALLEGNAFALRDVLEAIRAAGQEPAELVCVAGGARGDLLRQIRANVTGLPVTRPDDVETTARGAAMLAAAGCGLHPSVREAALAMAGPRLDPVLPDPECRAIYDDLYRRHRQLYAALRPVFARS
ncbi:MAG TPA: FGGY family carbohydrate kinase [Gaiellales bacterium]|nr:FGGY family carbohydrate kinase [Gaiellales bacterium]